MASAGAVAGKRPAVYTHSEEGAELLCCVCYRKDIRREASNYCVTCEEYYCKTCVNIHDDVPVLSNHAILQGRDFKGQGGGKLPSIPTERCPDHGTKLIDMYCETHSEVGCTLCMEQKHG